MNRGISNPGVRQCLGFCTAEFWSSLAYESAEQKPKHCLTPGFLMPLVMKNSQASGLLSEKLTQPHEPASKPAWTIWITVYDFIVLTWILWCGFCPPSSDGAIFKVNSATDDTFTFALSLFSDDSLVTHVRYWRHLLLTIVARREVVYRLTHVLADLG